MRDNESKQVWGKDVGGHYVIHRIHTYMIIWSRAEREKTEVERDSRERRIGKQMEKEKVEKREGEIEEWGRTCIRSQSGKAGSNANARKQPASQQGCLCIYLTLCVCVCLHFLKAHMIALMYVPGYVCAYTYAMNTCVCLCTHAYVSISMYFGEYMHFSGLQWDCCRCLPAHIFLVLSLSLFLNHFLPHFSFLYIFIFFIHPFLSVLCIPFSFSLFFQSILSHSFFTLPAFTLTFL